MFGGSALSPRWLTLVVAQPARAGGGSENVLLVVNSNSDSSKTIANAYIELRKIPPNHVLYIDWKGNLEATAGETFRDKILTPVVKALEERRLTSRKSTTSCIRATFLGESNCTVALSGRKIHAAV